MLNSPSETGGGLTSAAGSVSGGVMVPDPSWRKSRQSHEQREERKSEFSHIFIFPHVTGQRMLEDLW